MNDDWSRCPICYEEYSLLHRPTTFVCGHSTCIDHTYGNNSLRECPICRHSLNECDEHNVSYSLEEASRLYHLVKKTIDYSSIQLPSEDVPRSRVEKIRRTDGCTHDTLDFHEEKKNIVTRPTTILALILAVQARLQKSKHTGKQHKKCGHDCFLTATTQCCACADQRPQTESNGYDKYVDGHGMKTCGRRAEHYCPGCQQISV